MGNGQYLCGFSHFFSPANPTSTRNSGPIYVVDTSKIHTYVHTYSFIIKNLTERKLKRYGKSELLIRLLVTIVIKHSVNEGVCHDIILQKGEVKMMLSRSQVIVSKRSLCYTYINSARSKVGLYTLKYTLKHLHASRPMS
jgi:hypothetical protein